MTFASEKQKMLNWFLTYSVPLFLFFSLFLFLSIHIYILIFRPLSLSLSTSRLSIHSHCLSFFNFHSLSKFLSIFISLCFSESFYSSRLCLNFFSAIIMHLFLRLIPLFFMTTYFSYLGQLWVLTFVPNISYFKLLWELRETSKEFF